MNTPVDTVPAKADGDTLDHAIRSVWHGAATAITSVTAIGTSLFAYSGSTFYGHEVPVSLSWSIAATLFTGTLVLSVKTLRSLTKVYGAEKSLRKTISRLHEHKNHLNAVNQGLAAMVLRERERNESLMLQLMSQKEPTTPQSDGDFTPSPSPPRLH